MKKIEIKLVYSNDDSWCPKCVLHILNDLRLKNE